MNPYERTEDIDPDEYSYSYQEEEQKMYVCKSCGVYFIEFPRFFQGYCEDCLDVIDEEEEKEK